jgi:hypothetical protein
MAPLELVEARIAERFGWDWDTLDRQDEGRTLAAMTISGLATGYARVLAAVNAHNTRGLSESDWEAYRLLSDDDA